MGLLLLGDTIIKAPQSFTPTVPREMVPRSGGGSWAVTATCTAAAGLAILAIAHSRGKTLYCPSRRGPPVAGHAESCGATAVSPQGQALRRGDSYSTTIPLRCLPPGITDGEILARFTKGFFGGPIFTPERCFFAVSGYQITDVGAIREATAREFHQSKDGLTITQIRDSTFLETETGPSVGSLLFGNFLVLSSQTRAPPPPEPPSQPVPAGEGATVSYVDLVYGGGQRSPISGSHRFQVTRRSGQEAVDITFSAVTDVAESGWRSNLVFAFHTLYSHLLFSDAVRCVLNAKP